MMRAGFLIAILCVAIFYTYEAFELSFLSSTGRLGPGFFPRIIGIILVVTCLFSLLADRRAGYEAEAPSEFWRDALIIMVLSGIFVGLLDILGGLIAMIVYLGVTLSVFNRGRHVSNVAMSLLVPIGTYILFEIWLNAAVPEGMLDLPI